MTCSPKYLCSAPPGRQEPEQSTTTYIHPGRSSKTCLDKVSSNLSHHWQKKPCFKKETESQRSLVPAFLSPTLRPLLLVHPPPQAETLMYKILTKRWDFIFIGKTKPPLDMPLP